MKNSFHNRVRITKTGKLLRRKMGLSHFQAKKSNTQKHRKAKPVRFKTVDVKTIKRYL